MTDAGIILGFAAGAVICLALLVVIRSRRRGGSMISHDGDLPRIGGSFDATTAGRRVRLADGRDVLRLLEAGDRAGAVRLISERTGISEAEALAAIEKFESLRGRLES